MYPSSEQRSHVSSIRHQDRGDGNAFAQTQKQAAIFRRNPSSGSLADEKTKAKMASFRKVRQEYPK